MTPTPGTTETLLQDRGPLLIELLHNILTTHPRLLRLKRDNCVV